MSSPFGKGYSIWKGSGGVWCRLSDDPAASFHIFLGYPTVIFSPLTQCKKWPVRPPRGDFGTVFRPPRGILKMRVRHPPHYLFKWNSPLEWNWKKKKKWGKKKEENLLAPRGMTRCLRLHGMLKLLGCITIWSLYHSSFDKLFCFITLGYKLCGSRGFQAESKEWNLATALFSPDLENSCIFPVL